MVLGLICASAHGVSLPLLIIVFGDMIEKFVDNGKWLGIVNSINFTDFGTTKEEALGNQTALWLVLF